MIEFDIEAAKAGEPVECDVAEGRWMPAHFIGVSAEGYMVIQHQISDNKMTSAFCCKPSDLRMAPKKIQVRYRVGAYIDDDGAHPCVVETDLQADAWVGASKFMGWMTNWQEEEIPSESA